MADLKLPYLWFAPGRNKVKYPFYRSVRHRIELKMPDGRRIVGANDVAAITEAWTRIHASFSTAEAEPKSDRPKIGTILHGISEYRDSDEFKITRPNTQRGYNRALDWFGTKHGHRFWADFSHEAVLKIRNELSGTPSWANFVICVISVVANFVRRRPATFRLPKGWQNPAEGVKRLRTGPGHEPWEEDQIEAFRDEFDLVCLERAIFEALLGTGQRIGDVLKMKKSQYRRGEISIIQEKTGEHIWMLALDEFQQIIDPWLALHPYEWFFPNKNGSGPIHYTVVHKLMHHAFQTKIGLPVSCTLHALRYTFAVRSIEAGLDRRDIESIVGHRTYEMADKYTRKRRKSKLVSVTLNVALREERDRRMAARSCPKHPDL